MPILHLPDRLKPPRPNAPSRYCPAHRAWVRRHHCSVPGCRHLPIECAHVRSATDGGTGLKPSDRWCISLCSHHHAEQHRIGELRFEKRHGICLADLAELFAQRSPHRRALADELE
jgi:hypothetical protein